MEGILLKRSELGDCKRCGLSSEGEEFKGRFNNQCTHMDSQNGWWLRIDHSRDIYKEGGPRNPDKVGELLCPKCLDKHNVEIGKLLDF